MIPSFAIERAQELIFDLNHFAEKKLLPKVKVYLDSPMAIKATEVFKKHTKFYNEEIKLLLEKGDNPFEFPGLTYSNKVEDSKKINQTNKPCIIIAGSGMCTAGRIKHHIKQNIGDPRNTILFVGFQVIGSLGYWIKKGEKRIRLLGTERIVKAQVESIESFSAHADYNGLIDWIKNFKQKPKKVFITHGDEEATISLSDKIKKLNIKTYIPDMFEEILI